MKTPKLKARRMWANPADFGEQSMPLTAHRDPSSDRGNVAPVAVIPLDDVEALVERATEAYWRAAHEGKKHTNGECMRAALAAIGVLPRARKERK